MNFPPPLRTSYPFPPNPLPYTTIAASGGTFLYRAAYAPTSPKKARMPRMPTTIKIVSSPAILSLPPSHLFDDEGTSLHSSDLNALACPQALLRDGGDQGASRRLGDDEDLSPDSGLHGHGDLPVRSNQILEPILARGLGLHEDVDHRVVHDGGQDRREDPRREGDPERGKELGDLHHGPEYAEE